MVEFSKQNIPESGESDLTSVQSDLLNQSLDAAFASSASPRPSAPQSAYPATQVKGWVHAAVQPFVKVWPLQTFIACNPLIHYEDLSFFDAIQQAETDLRWQGPFQPAFLKHLYRTAIEAGHVSEAQLSDHLDTYLKQHQLDLVRIGPDAMPLKAFLWADWEAAFSSATDDDLALPEDDAGNADALMPFLLTWLKSERAQAYFMQHADSGTLLLSERVGELSGQPVALRIDEQLVKWCASFLDQGQAVWSMPNRELGLRGAWQLLACYDHHLTGDEAKRLGQCLKQLPADSDAAIGLLLNWIGVPEAEAEAYLRGHFAALPGWVGHLRWVTEQTGTETILSDYLVVRLSYEYALSAAISLPQWHCEPNLQALDSLWQEHQIRSGHSGKEVLSLPEVQAFARRLLRLTGLMNLPLSAVAGSLQTTGEALLCALSEFDWHQKGRLLLEAMEAAYQTALLQQLKPQVPVLAAAPEPGHSALQAQAVFCIDVRSESFRRQLEAQGGVQTFGFAGFFGASIQLTAFGDCHSKDLCPALLKPGYVLAEAPIPDVAERAHWHLGNKLSRKHFKMALLSLKREPSATFGYVETVGLVHSVPMILGTLFPRLSLKLKHYFKHLMEPNISVRPHLTPDTMTHTADETLQLGMPLAAQVQVAEGMLNSIGLREGFAPFVLLCGHGAQVANNPYASALDCGACGGNQGGSNARVLAEILNTLQVREQLAERGIVIPARTHFLAAEHNTVTDEVQILNTYCLANAGSEVGREFQRLEKVLTEAAARNRAVRSALLPSFLEPSSYAGEHLHDHAIDWSQIRPEWGLAGNAAFIIGPRSLTTDVNLEGRAFLHSYDWQNDPDGKVLEGILTAPLVVGEWINLQYWFSLMDNHRFGSASKVQHNVVGQLGVMLGNASDLQLGLPQQSVMRDPETPYHMPLRLTAIVVAPVETVNRLIQRQPVLQTLFHNEWVKLVVLDPVTGQFQRYGSEGHWARVA